MTALMCRIFGHRWVATIGRTIKPMCCRCGRVRGAGQ